MWKIIGGFIGLFLLVTVIGAGCNWFSNGAKVVQQEFSPEAMLKKYEWFKNQSEFIKKGQMDIVNLKSESNIKSKYESDNGKDHSRWSPITVNAYQEEVSMNTQQRLAQVSTVNKLIADYNAQSAKFNWSAFQTRDDLPPPQFESVK